MKYPLAKRISAGIAACLLTISALACTKANKNAISNLYDKLVATVLEKCPE